MLLHNCLPALAAVPISPGRLRRPGAAHHPLQVLLRSGGTPTTLPILNLLEHPHMCVYMCVIILPAAHEAATKLSTHAAAVAPKGDSRLVGHGALMQLAAWPAGAAPALLTIHYDALMASSRPAAALRGEANPKPKP
jgi:hypothetical protein